MIERNDDVSEMHMTVRTRSLREPTAVECHQRGGGGGNLGFRVLHKVVARCLCGPKFEEGPTQT